MRQSVAIIEWLDETVPEPALLPEDPFLRARVRERVQLIKNAARFGADISACTEVQRVYEACMQTPEAIATQPRG